MEIRLQKIIADVGIASRRKAEEMILAGLVTVNGHIITELGTKADPQTDHIKVRGKLLKKQTGEKELLYILLYKPVGFMSTRSDPKKRPLVIDLLGKFRNKVHPVGRLDFNSEGLILLTNDCNFTNMVAHASKKVAKVYDVKIKGKPKSNQINQIQRGATIDGSKTAPSTIKLIEESDTNAWYEVTLYEGQNRQIRKMFDSIGHSVIKLKRKAIGFLKNEKLKPGDFRFLSEIEVKRFFKGFK